MIVNKNQKYQDRKWMQENIGDPKFLAPFCFEWKREHVLRITVSHKNQSDVYYIFSTEHKLRSKREVQRWFDNKRKC